MAGTPSTTLRDHAQARGLLFAWIIGLGVFLVFNTLLLGQEDLQSVAAPIHIALLGFLGGVLLSARSRRARPLKLWAIAGLASLITFVSSLTGQNALVLGGGWLVLVAWGSLVAIRGERR